MKRILKNYLSAMGYKLSSTKYIPKPFLTDQNILQLEFDHVLADYLINSKDENQFTFIQIGAFDGVECDPLYKYLKRYDWKGVMLEPQPIPFEKLKKQYESRPNITVVNAALNQSKGKSTLYILEGDHLPEWSKGMASFSRENILKLSLIHI